MYSILETRKQCGKRKGGKHPRLPLRLSSPSRGHIYTRERKLYKDRPTRYPSQNEFPCSRCNNRKCMYRTYKVVYFIAACRMESVVSGRIGLRAFAHRAHALVLDPVCPCLLPCEARILARKSPQCRLSARRRGSGIWGACRSELHLIACRPCAAPAPAPAPEPRQSAAS